MDRTTHDSTDAPTAPGRPEVRGKFLWIGDRKLWVKGVTYGTFRPNAEGVDYPSPRRVDEDFAGMAAAGFNTVRTYTPPPAWLLDIAHRHGLYVMIGLPWEQHIAFLDDRKRADSIEQRVREAVRPYSGHPGVLCYTIGNEIPASIVRWHGRERIERFLHRLYRAAKDEDPGGLVTYVNFPTTEYLELPFLDFCAFNVYLEQEERLEAYLGRLQVVAGDRPLLMAEIGLDSRGAGEEAQAISMRWQLSTAFRTGCAGATVFAWTDEWHRGGHDIEDWDFGLVRRDRTPKLALDAVRETMGDLPMPSEVTVPRISVVVCSFNGSRTLAETLEAILVLDYPDFEVILVDDGSTDNTAAIGHAYGARVISTENRGLSSARNTGAYAATGEIVAYCDDDAYPDPHWLSYLASTYMTTRHVAVGGPNLPPPGDGRTAECVANAPGNAVHVLLTDTLAEHIPGCNSSFRRDALLEIGGFDEQFRIAGDDVDVCWRLQERGGTIGFHHAAMVWHHRRPCVRSFWRQQRNYGRAEAMLERKWPDKYNHHGHLTWHGRVYSPGRRTLLERWHVYYGTWGSGLFQRLYSAGQPRLASFPLMPEWFLVIALLAAVTGLGAMWSPLLLAGPVLAVAIAAVAAEAWMGAGRARFTFEPDTRRERLTMRGLTAFLYAMQSYARLHGRVTEGLAPWGRRSRPALAVPRTRNEHVWSEGWSAPETWLERTEAKIVDEGTRVRRGGDFDDWDLEIRGGAFASARLRMAVEEHGGGKQLLRYRIRPIGSRTGKVGALVSALLAAPALSGHVVVGSLLAALAVVLVVGMATEAAGAIAATRRALQALRDEAESVALEMALAAVEAEEPVEAAINGNGNGNGHALAADLVHDVRPGEVAALVASDADGRRALADLLAELCTASAQQRAVSRQIGVAIREPLFLPLTVAENIALRRPNATREDVERAAAASGADDFIRGLPRSYDTVVGAAGSHLTTDQRLRLALAQTYVEDQPVLVVGEPFGAPGNVAEEAVVLTESLVRAADADRVLVVGGEQLARPAAA